MNWNIHSLQWTVFLPLKTHNVANSQIHAFIMNTQCSDNMHETVRWIKKPQSWCLVYTIVTGLHYGHGLPVVHVSLKRIGTCNIIVVFVLNAFWYIVWWSVTMIGSERLYEWGSWVPVPQNWTEFHHGLVRVYQVLPWMPLRLNRFLQVLSCSSRSVQVPQVLTGYMKV